MKTIFICNKCGSYSPKWMGRCTECGGWNTLTEERIEKERGGRRYSSESPDNSPKRLSEITVSQEDRYSTDIREFDRILGGGVVSGSVILIGGDPGIGKSTLILQVLNNIANNNNNTLYVSGEESCSQIKMRGERLGINAKDIYMLSATSLNEIFNNAEKLLPQVIVIDSIQTIFTTEIQSAPGSVSQVREVATQLMFFAKKRNMTIFIIGHVTKDGAIAGPRLLEHIVDTVLYFEGDRSHSYRILRAVKNRFGSTNEIGIFEMNEDGLKEVYNPSEIFLSERAVDIAGSAVTSCMEGTRPILVELQALTNPANIGMPRRRAIGVDPNRVSLLLAVLEKRVELHIQGFDVFINVVGGIQINEPACDLCIIAVITSSFLDKFIDTSTIVLGEVGLAGEIRAISHTEKRLKEASKMGFKRAIIPLRNADRLQGMIQMEIIAVTQIKEALDILFYD